MSKIRLERVYEDPAGTTGGYRVFVDRLWPRGESKEKFHYDLWVKDVAPSTDLREWYHADPDARWDEFKSRYEAELNSNPAAAHLAAALKSHPDIVLLYASRDTEHNNAVVLASWLAPRL
ncbi:MAG: DUF488 family protein [Candidatus Amulumruptor sp.]